MTHTRHSCTYSGAAYLLNDSLTHSPHYHHLTHTHHCTNARARRPSSHARRTHRLLNFLSLCLSLDSANASAILSEPSRPPPSEAARRDTSRHPDDDRYYVFRYSDRLPRLTRCVNGTRSRDEAEVRTMSTTNAGREERNARRLLRSSTNQRQSTTARRAVRWPFHERTGNLGRLVRPNFPYHGRRRPNGVAPFLV